jgi:predicted GIY-YIG superfamily endonuclease
MYTLYWIKNCNCEDPFKHGYIGITKQSLNERFLDHKNNHKNKYLKNRCRQSDTTIVSLFENLSKDDAQKLEFKYRPEENIGWNINKGGDLPPCRKGKVSEKSLLRGENRTQKQIKGHQLQSETMKKHWAEGRYVNKKKKVSKKERSFNCLVCGVAKTTRSQTAKYCSRKCSAVTNKDPTKRKLIAEKAKKRWESAKYKEKVSESIRKTLSSR